jgi:hypothetical protein
MRLTGVPAYPPEWHERAKYTVLPGLLAHRVEILSRFPARSGIAASLRLLFGMNGLPGVEPVDGV